jgi:Icc-related predicted phosphoesterase
VIRIAAVGDVHYDRQPRKEMRAHFTALGDRADLLLIAGDLTQAGTVEEASALISDLSDVQIPVVTVLGNHDFHSDLQEEISDLLREAGITVLEGQNVTFDVRGISVGVAGIKGFGGGFFGACVTEFGERETRSFAHHARVQAEILKSNLMALDTEYRFALTHFSPVDGTLLGEKREIYPFLGSYLLAEAIDSSGADAAFHGHAHKGVERGVTPGGVPVRNVALNVIRHAYNIYTFEHKAATQPTERQGDLDPALPNSY